MNRETAAAATFGCLVIGGIIGSLSFAFFLLYAVVHYIVKFW